MGIYNILSALESGQDWQEILLSSSNKSRRSYTNKFKFTLIQIFNSLVNRGVKPCNVKRALSLSTGVSFNTCRKWFSEKKRNQIIAAIVSDKTLGKSKHLPRQDSWSDALKVVEEKLYEEIQTKRGKGLRVNFKVASHIAKRFSLNDSLFASKSQRQSLPTLRAKISFTRTWFASFLSRYQLSLRKPTNKKNKNVLASMEAAKEFHHKLFNYLKKVSDEQINDSVYGLYPPENRYNADQVGVSFVNNAGAKTISEKGSRRVWVRQTKSSMDKRMATVHLTIRPRGDTQVKPIVIFRGKGAVFQQEKDLYDKRVNVLFQKNAWVDDDIALKIVKLYEKDAAINNNQANLFFLDNLRSHTQKKFKSAMSKGCSATCFYLPPGETDCLQPVDAGCGANLKSNMSNLLDEKLDSDPGFEKKWINGSLSTTDYRVVLTEFVGDAFERMCIQKQHPFWKYFEKTGCLMSLDGSNHDRIRPEGMEKTYSFLFNE